MEDEKRGRSKKKREEEDEEEWEPVRRVCKCS